MRFLIMIRLHILLKSREELVKRAWDELAPSEAGQGIPPEDYQRIDGEVDALMSELYRKSIYSNGNRDEVDDWAFTHIAVLLANACAVSYGIPFSQEIQIFRESRLKEMRNSGYVGQKQEVQYF